MEYVIFRCTECDAVVAYPSRTADGRRCSECKGFIVPIDKGTKQELIGKHGDSIVFNPPAKEQGRATDNETLAIHIVVPKVMLQTWGAKDIKEFMLKQAAEAIESALKGMPSRTFGVE